MNRLLALAVMLTTAFMGWGNERLDALVTRGNRAYEAGQRDEILECADSLKLLIADERLEGDALKDYTVSLLKLYGNYHYENGALDPASFAEAEGFYNRADSIMGANPNTAFSGDMRTLILRERAQLFYRLARYEEALADLRRADERMEYMYQNVGDGRWLLEKMSLAITLARTEAFSEAISIAETELANALDKTGEAYAKAQRMYAKILMLADVRREGASKAYRKYFQAQKKYASDHFARMTARQREQYWLSLRPFMADCYRLEDADAGLLYDVTLFSKGLLLQLSRISGEGPASKKALRTLGYTWKDIRRKLQPGQAAVEFVEYEKEGEQRMGALVLKSEGEPIFIALTSPSDILDVAGEALRSTSLRGKKRLYTDSELQSMVWTPALLEALKGSDRVYFAPDGYMHRMAIEYMPQVSDKELFRLTSTRRLMEPHAVASDMSMLLCGGIDYDRSDDPVRSGANDPVAFSNYRGTIFRPLAAQYDESAIILAARNNPADTLLTGSGASERRFRELAARYPSIMVSTHGDFRAKSLPVPNDLKPVESDDVLSQNIIAFAGTNGNLRRDDFPSDTDYDGILSARELGALDLSGCRLFTMSACQTALGHITSEGVFGLQRGLKNAGVGAMLLSLWSVHSGATSRLMQNFYTLLGQGMPMHRAFTEARRSLVESRHDAGDPADAWQRDFSSPQFTDPFILIDALE